MQTTYSSLEQVIKETIQLENQSNHSSILYQVFENDQLIYVGIGGKNKRKGSGRLKEHKSNSMYSSFRFQYYIKKWDEGLDRNKVDEMWSKLKWKVTLSSFDDVNQLETNIITEHNPMFNRD
jgi:hypothetical protein